MDTSYPSVGLVAHDPSWAARFAAARDSLVDVLGSGWTVEHIGSTAVPGLVAKPVIDLAVRVPSGGTLTPYDDALTAVGWVEVGSSVTTHDVRMRLDGSVRTHIAHFFPADGWETAHQRLFVARLLTHDDERDRYAALKESLRAAGTWGRAYTDAKGAFVQEVVDRARAERGLPPVVVTDKR